MSNYIHRAAAICLHDALILFCCFFLILFFCLQLTYFMNLIEYRLSLRIQLKAMKLITVRPIKMMCREEMCSQSLNTFIYFGRDGGHRTHLMRAAFNDFNGRCTRNIINSIYETVLMCNRVSVFTLRWLKLIDDGYDDVQLLHVSSESHICQIARTDPIDTL